MRRALYFDQEKVFLDNICDEFEIDIDDERTEDISDSNISYAFEEVNKYLRLDESIMEVIELKKFDTYTNLKNYYDSLDDTNKRKYIYEAGGKQYIDYRDGNNRYLKKVNQFRNLTRDKKKDTIELKIIPVQMELATRNIQTNKKSQIEGAKPKFSERWHYIVRMKAKADDYNGKPGDVQELI